MNNSESQAQVQAEEAQDTKFKDLVPGHNQHEDLIIQSGPTAKFPKPCRYCGKLILVVRWERFVLERSTWLVFTAKRHGIDHNWSAWELSGDKKHECSREQLK